MGQPAPETDRKSNSLGAWLLIFASPALLLIGGKNEPAADVPGRAASETAPAARPAVLEPSEECVKRFLAPLEAMAYRARPDGAGVELQTPTPPWRERVRAALDGVRTTLGSKPQLDAFIATIADPIDSGLGYQFDTSLKALRAGLEEAVKTDGGRFNRDRTWLPWDDRDVEGDERRASEECRRSLPGLVLFRSGPHDRPRLRGLLLVGETPTAGLHRAAFVSALEIAALFGGSSGALGGKIGIVGPTFSGSAYSMRLALEHWASLNTSLGSKGVRIITGAATGSGLPALLTAGKSSDPNWFGRGSVEFHSTTPNEADLQCRYLRFLNWRRLASREERTQKKDIVLSEVALLHERGTEFGTALQHGESGAPEGAGVTANPAAPRCTTRPGVTQSEVGPALRAGLDLSFPVHIGRLRDAYEDMDRSGTHASGPEPVGRRTSLEISLREKRPGREGETEPSPKTTYAEDVAVAHLLGVISRSSVAHVAIQATDVGDAIFLARKIRDVAPDVRIAFLSADILLLHPSFERDLKGSLVVNAYPFFGANDFLNHARADDSRRYIGFEGSASEGTYNAALALRGASFGEFSNYTFTDHNVVLPIWIAAIGSSQLVPINVRENHTQVYAGSSADLIGAKLMLDHGVGFPRFWHFLFASLALGFCVDQVQQRRAARSLSHVRTPSRTAAGTDIADDSVIKTKWELYAAIRSFVFAMALAYMAYVYWCTFGLYAGLDRLGRAIICGAAAVAVIAIGFALVKTTLFAADYVALGRAVGKRSPLIVLSALFHFLRRRVWPGLGCSRPVNSRLDRWDRSMLFLGLARAENVSAAALSFCQLRALANLALAVSALFVGVEVWVLVDDAGQTGPARSLMVQRSLSLIGGISPSAPTLLCLALAYVWAFGRMARLELSHGLSQITPAAGSDCAVSTPIRFILYPNHTNGQAADESFGHIERHAMNSIVRPITGPDYCIAVGILALLPVILFWLKPVSTLERQLLTLLLMGGLGLCVFLILNTLVQLVQYWLALKQLLKRVLQHRLGRSFERVARFVRDSLEDQISRTPHDVLRLGACASRFDELVRWSELLVAESGLRFAPDELRRLAIRRSDVEAHRVRAMAADATAKNDSAETEAALGRSVIEGAHELMLLLIRAWDGRLGQFSTSRTPVPPGPPSSIGPPPSAFSNHEPPGASEQLQTSAHQLRPPPSVIGTVMPSPLASNPNPRPAAETWPLGYAPETSEPKSRSVGATSQFAAAQAIARDSYAAAPPSAPPAVVTPTPPSGTQNAAAASTDTDDARDSLDDALRAEGWRYSSNQRAWLREAEAFVATVVALLLSRHVRQFHTFVRTLTLCSLVLLLAILSYPFEPHRLLLTFVMGVVIGVVVVGFWVYIELDRSTLLSHIAGTVPGKLTLDAAFLQRVFAWGFVPLLVIAAAQYPDVANALLRVADPILKALR